MFYSGFIPSDGMYCVASGIIGQPLDLFSNTRYYDRQPETRDVKPNRDYETCRQCGCQLTNYVSVQSVTGPLGNYCWSCAAFIEATESFLPRATERALLDSFVKPPEPEQKIESVPETPKSKWETWRDRPSML